LAVYRKYRVWSKAFSSKSIAILRGFAINAHSNNS